MNRKKFFNLFHYRVFITNTTICDYCGKEVCNFLKEHLRGDAFKYVCKNCFCDSSKEYAVLVPTYYIDNYGKKDNNNE